MIERAQLREQLPVPPVVPDLALITVGVEIPDAFALELSAVGLDDQHQISIGDRAAAAFKHLPLRPFYVGLHENRIRAGFKKRVQVPETVRARIPHAYRQNRYPLGPATGVRRQVPLEAPYPLARLGPATPMNSFPRLFAPYSSGRLALRNRIVMAPHGTAMVRDGLITDDTGCRDIDGTDYDVWAERVADAWDRYRQSPGDTAIITQQPRPRRPDARPPNRA